MIRRVRILLEEVYDIIKFLIGSLFMLLGQICLILFTIAGIILISIPKMDTVKIYSYTHINPLVVIPGFCAMICLGTCIVYYGMKWEKSLFFYQKYYIKMEIRRFKDAKQYNCKPSEEYETI